MVIHSDSELGVFFLFVVLLAAAGSILIAAIGLLEGNLRFAGKALGVGLGLFAFYVLVYFGADTSLMHKPTLLRVL